MDANSRCQHFIAQLILPFAGIRKVTEEVIKLLGTKFLEIGGGSAVPMMTSGGAAAACCSGDLPIYHGISITQHCGNLCQPTSTG